MVLNWTVENLYPLKVLADRPHWLALSYEETVLDPEGTFTRVKERLSLTDTDRMRRAAARASASSGLSQRETLAAIAARDEDQIVGRWREQISESDRTDVARILNTFGVTLYSADSAMPNWAGYRSRYVQSDGRCDQPDRALHRHGLASQRPVPSGLRDVRRHGAVDRVGGPAPRSLSARCA